MVGSSTLMHMQNVERTREGEGDREIANAFY